MKFGRDLLQSCIKYSTNKYQYQYIRLKYKYQYQWSKYQYKYQYLTVKYKYQYQYIRLKYKYQYQSHCGPSTSTSTST